MNIDGGNHARFMMVLACAVLHSVLLKGDLPFWVLCRADTPQAADSLHHAEVLDAC